MYLNKLASPIIPCLFLTVATTVLADMGIEIREARLVATNPYEATVEVEYAMNSKLGVAAVAGVASSNDSTTVSHPGTSSPAVGPRQSGKVLIIVRRPAEPKKHVTDKLKVIFGFLEHKGEVTRTFDMPISWPLVVDARDLPESAQYIFTSHSLDWRSRDYFVNGDFDALENLVAEWNHSDKRDIDGNWKLSHFLGGLRDEFQDTNHIEYLELLQQWRQRSPKSTALVLTEAYYWWTYSRRILGDAYYQSKDPFAIRLSQKRLHKAEEVLLAGKEYAAKSPVWYQLLIMVGTHLKRDDRYMQQLFTEATAKHPTYPLIYTVMNLYLAPYNEPEINWRAVDEIIAKGVKNTQITDGNITYANLYLAIAYPRPLTFNLLRDTHASWPKLRKALEERAKSFPSPRNVNELAAYACMAEDSVAYFRIRPFLKSIAPNVWMNNYSPDLCDRRFLKRA